MSNYTSEQASHELQELNESLRIWHENCDPDSTTAQNIRGSEYWEGVRVTQEIVEGVQPEQRVLLTVGGSPIESVRFRRTPYDRQRVDFGGLKAGSKLELRKAELVTYTLGETREELFVGFVVKVALSEVAKTLAEGGELSLIGAPRSARTAA